MSEKLLAEPATEFVHGNVYDLIRHNTTGELFLTDQWKSGELIAENPSFSIVGIGLSREATDTPFGKIGAVLE